MEQDHSENEITGVKKLKGISGPSDHDSDENYPDSVRDEREPLDSTAATQHHGSVAFTILPTADEGFRGFKFVVKSYRVELYELYWTWRIQLEDLIFGQYHLDFELQD